MRFDYYSATLPCRPSHSEEMIKRQFGGHFSKENPVKPYKMALRHSETDYRLYWGGHNPLPFFVASGASSAPAAVFLRGAYPGHRVSRADVAFDFDRPNGFDDMVSSIDPIARRANVDVCFNGDPDPTKRTGRTMYYGSPKSDVRICVYEKGLHEASKGVLDASPDWVRVELRVRPRKERKSLCAKMPVSKMWGLSRWSSSVSSDVLGGISPFIPDPSLRRSQTDQAVAHMLRQYAGSLRRFVSEHGKEQLFQQINEVLDA